MFRILARKIFFFACVLFCTSAFAQMLATSSSVNVMPPETESRLYTCSTSHYTQTYQSPRWNCMAQRSAKSCNYGDVVTGLYSKGMWCYYWCARVVPICGWVTVKKKS